MKSRQKRRQRRDQEIAAAWDLFEEGEPDISTERLMGMVQDQTGAEPDRQIAALVRLGKITPKS